MIIDSHQHFWTLSRGDYAWPDDSVAPIFRDFSPSDLLPLLKAAEVTRSVLVQATDSIQETVFLLDLAKNHDWIAGVVGWVDLTAQDSNEKLDQLRAHPQLKGIRPMLQGIDNTEWILHSDAAQALDYMQKVGLRFDALIQPRHLPVIEKLALRYPDLAIVVDHIAKPVITSAAVDFAWQEGIKRLASLTNVYCKLSGMVTEAGPHWCLQDLQPFSELVLQEFGPDKVMFGSDWPVVNLASDYATWLETVQTLIADFSESDQKKIMGLTAVKFYGL